MNILTRIVERAVTVLIRGLDTILGVVTDVLLKALDWAAYELGFTARRPKS